MELLVVRNLWDNHIFSDKIITEDFYFGAFHCSLIFPRIEVKTFYEHF